MLFFLCCFFFTAFLWPLQATEAVETPIVEKTHPPAYCYFHLPEGWEIAERPARGKQVKMAFVKKAKKEGFCPSLNLAMENIEGTLNDYLNDVRAIHEQDRKNHWRKLGKVRTLAGEAQLTEIDTFSHLGAVRMLQLILLKDGTAYIVTAAALKKDISNYYRDFQEVFHSLTITTDLFEAIPQAERREAIKNALDTLLMERTNFLNEGQEFYKKHWIPFHDKIMEECNSMGLFWQALALQYASDQMAKCHDFSCDKK